MMPTKLPPGVGAATGGPKKRLKGRYRHVVRGEDGMNKTERRYAEEYLAPRKESGEIVDFDFEPESLKLADKVRYVPDFRVLEGDGTILFVDVKAGKRDGTYLAENNSVTKARLAAEKHPYRFCFAWFSKPEGCWIHKEF